MWHHAHEWVRANLREIVRVYLDCPGEGVDICPYFGGLPEECFADDASEIIAGSLWSEHVPTPSTGSCRSEMQEPLGDMIHAFPRTRMLKHMSWMRDPFDKQYLMLMSDGDLAMLGGLAKGLAEGQAFRAFATIKHFINGCGFHKPRSMELNLNARLNRLKVVLRVGSNGVRQLLEENDTFQRLFGALVEECIQTDCPVLGAAAWAIILRKCEVYGLTGLGEHFERYHNPRTGRQGVWGRWNHVQEEAQPHPPDNQSPGATTCVPCESSSSVESPPFRPLHTIHQVTRGTAGTSNPLEGNMNKKLKIGAGMSLPYGVLTTMAQHVMTALSEDMAALEFSVVPDQQGECTRSFHPKQSGPWNTQKTGTW